MILFPKIVSFSLHLFSLPVSLSVAVCTVCGLPSMEGNGIIMCDGCQAAVHISCYAVTDEELKKDKWFCLPCRKNVPLRLPDGSPNPERTCCVCNHMGGAFSITEGNKWVHTSCALYLPDTKFSDTAVVTLPKFPDNPAECCICHNRFGITRKCSFFECPNHVHVHCVVRSLHYSNS